MRPRTVQPEQVYINLRVENATINTVNKSNKVLQAEFEKGSNTNSVCFNIWKMQTCQLTDMLDGQEY